MQWRVNREGESIRNLLPCAAANENGEYHHNNEPWNRNPDESQQGLVCLVIATWLTIESIPVVNVHVELHRHQLDCLLYLRSKELEDKYFN